MQTREQESFFPSYSSSIFPSSPSGIRQQPNRNYCFFLSLVSVLKLFMQKVLRAKCVRNTIKVRQSFINIALHVCVDLNPVCVCHLDHCLYWLIAVSVEVEMLVLFSW